VIEQVLDSYHLAFHRPVNAVYCLDSSGSMADNGGWDHLKQAEALLFDPVQARKYLIQLNPKDRTTVLVFANSINFRQAVDGNKAADLGKLLKSLQGLSANGGTAI